MRAVSRENAPTSDERRPGARASARTSMLRKTRLRSLAIEPLEARTLLSTLPPITTNPSANTTLVTSTGNQVNPSVAIDPNDPTKMVAVWVQDDPAHPLANFNGVAVTAFAEGAYSTDSGATWQPLFGSFGDIVTDFTVTSNAPPLPAVTDASVAFDANNNFYIADEAHKADYSVGQLTTERYSFASATPTQTMTDNVALRWGSALKAVYKPILTADANHTTVNGQTDPNTGFTTQTGGPFGAVYIAASSDANGANPRQNSQALLLTSFDGAQNFAQAVLSGGSEQATAPTIAVSQGNTSKTVPAGQATVVWDDTSPKNADDLNVNTAVPDPKTYASAITPNAPIATPPQPTPANLTITPAVTTVPLLISGTPADFSLVKLTASVSLNYPDLREISIQLVAPNGQSLFLLKNGETATATSANNVVTTTVTPVNPAQGAGSAGNNLSATFDDTATRPIKGSGGNNGAATAFTAEAGTLANAFGGLSGLSAKGQWKLVITSYVPDAAAASAAVTSFGLTLNGVRIGGENSVVSLTPGGNVRGNVNGGNFPDAGSTLAVPNRGIDPAPQIASDNTLGPNSPYEGRLYVTYVDRSTNKNNPADNTDIYLISSDDGGATWSTQVPVNDDNARVDGFSESTRPQFQPSVAVDPASGMVAVSFFDARNDAARARVATYVGVSVDGGATFSPETYVNTPQQAIDEANNAVVTLGPIPDNQSAASGIADTNFNFGDHQALVFFKGSVMPVWSSNQNGGVDLKNGLANPPLLSQITIAHATTPVGPRVVTVTQGPVGGPADALNPNPSPTSGPALGAFQVTFDRPIDVSSFVPADVQLLNNGTTGAGVKYTGGFTITPQSPSNGFASTFLVALNTPQTAVGAYSIAVAPASPTDIRTDIQYYNGTTLVTSESMDQDTNPADAGLNTNVYPTSNLNGDGPDVSLPLIVPGPHIVGTSVPGGAGADNEVLNGTVSSIDVTFDRNMNPATIVGHPEIVLRMMGPAGLIGDRFTVTQPNPADLTTYRITFLSPTTGLPDPQSLNGTYTVTLASTVKDSLGNALDTNLNAGLYRFRGSNPYGTDTPVSYTAAVPAGGLPIPSKTPTSSRTLLVPVTVPDSFLVQGVSANLTINYPYDPDLTATLLAPGAVVNPDGTVSGPSARLFSGVGANGSAANFTNTTFVSSSSPGITSVSAGGAPFLNGTFNALDSFAPFQGIRAKGTWYLYIQAAGTKTGTLNSFTLTLQENVSAASTGLGEPVADQATVSFRVFTDAPTNPLSTGTWTSAGPSGINGGSKSGRVGGLAADPSDPSGNTVYVGGASGGIWKTTDFLTSAPGGPTWVPLTDFGPTNDNNIGGLAVFPVNNDPSQSIIFAATGEADTGSAGNGFLRSLDGGAHWQFLDSTNNTPGATHDHLFSVDGTTAFKIVVDPKLNANGDVIVYAALSGSGPTGGIWRSLDSGLTWTRMRAGNATDVTLDPLSGTGSPSGNLQVVYGAFGGDGVYRSPNQGSSWFEMLGTAGDPLIQDFTSQKPIPVVTPAGSTPNGATKTRIQLAKPFLTGVASEDLIYQGYLYALVSNGGAYDGLYLTKDNGSNWTKVHIATAAGIGQGPFNPSNNVNLPDYDPLGGQGSYNLSLAIDPTNPNVVYIGGSSNPATPGGPFGAGFLRVDTTGILDAHNAAPYSGSQPDNGLTQRNSVGGVTPIDNTKGISPLGPGDLPYLNLIRNPANFFSASSVFFTGNIKQFNNTGADSRWIPFGDALAGSTDQHRLLTLVDPLTGRARLIIGDDQGVFTGVDDNGAYIESNLGTANVPFGSRNGNLVLTQFYYGSAQPSAHDSGGNARDVTLYGDAQDTGGSESSGLLTAGNTAWSSGATGGGGDYVGVATDSTGSGTVYRFLVPADGAPSPSGFFQINGTDYVNGLNNLPGDPNTEWGYAPIGEGPALAVGLFAVNPINGQQIVISSSQGTVYRTEDQGLNWTPIGNPTDLDSSYVPALTFGAPAQGSLNQDNLIYAGTVKGNIFRYYTGGGTSGTPWTNISSGLTGAGTIRQIVADPNPGTTDAYAVAQNGVFYLSNSLAATPTWTRITGNLFSLLTPATGDVVTAVGDTPTSVSQTTQVSYLTSIQADWRYALPNQPGNAAAGTHPVLYVAGNSGVYRSLDGGTTWTDFPNTDPLIDAAPVNGGYLPHVTVTSLTLSDGNVNPATGRATISTAGGVSDPSLLSLSTYGQGSFFIQLAPIILPSSAGFTPASVSGKDAQGNPLVRTNQPVIAGYSEQSAYGNAVTVTIYDSNNPTLPIGTGRTDATGHFQVTVNPTGFTTNGAQTLLIQATDASGTKGNRVSLPFTLQTNIVNPNSPPTAPTLGLLPGSDSSNGLNVTNVKAPVVGGVTDPGVSVQVYIVSVNGVPNGQVFSPVLSDSSGNYRLQLPNLLDGSYVIQADATNTTNHLTSKSRNFSFQVLTAGPTSAPTFYLEDASGRPIASRFVTTTARVPTFVGSSAPNASVSIYLSANGVTLPPALNTARADGTGRYEIHLPTNLNDGTITLQVRATDAAGNQAPAPSAPLTLTVVTAPADYTGGGKTLPSLFRRNANGTVSWVIKGVTSAAGTVFPGGSSTQDIPLQGDFEGDGKTDEALYRPSAGAFFIARSKLGGETVVLNANPPAGTVPVVGDFDGDGVTDVGTYTPSNGQWTLDQSTDGLQTVTFHNAKVFTTQAGDVPVPGDYDGTGVSELAVYRPSTDQFFIKVGATPASGVDNIRVINSLDPSHNPGDIPVPGNYDDSLAQHFTEAAVFNPSTGAWYIQGHSQPIQFNPGDVPAPGDYDGLGRTETAVYRPKIAAFAVNGPSGIVPLGVAGDIPLTAPFAYRNLPAAAPTVALFNARTPGGTSTAARHPIFGGAAAPGEVVDLVNAAGAVVNATVADGNGVYAVGDPATLGNGTYYYTVRGVSLVGGITPSSPVQAVTVETVRGDYAGTGLTQPALFVRGPNKSLTFYVRNDRPLNGLPFYTGAGDVPVVGDFLGIGTDQIAIFTPGTGNWVIAQASTGYQPQLYLKNFGTGGNFTPVPANYFGGGVDEAAVYQANTGQWYIQGLAKPVGPITPFQAGDVPVPAHYDAINKDELAVYRPGNQTWYISSAHGTRSFVIPGFVGAAGDIPVPGTYFSTTATEAVWRPSTGQFVIYNNLTGRTTIDRFAVGDVPAPGDYDGVGHAEAAVFRPGTGQFLVMGPNDAAPRALYPASQPFGGSGFLPVEAPNAYRAVPVTPAVRTTPRVIKHLSVDLGASARTLAASATSRTATVKALTLLKSQAAPRNGV